MGLKRDCGTVTGMQVCKEVMSLTDHILPFSETPFTYLGRREDMVGKNLSCNPKEEGCYVGWGSYWDKRAGEA